jgi:hypothetical protein
VPPPPSASTAPPVQTAAKPAHAPPPDVFARIGEPCAEHDAGDLPGEICGSDGRVAGVFVMVDTAGPFPPESAERIRHEPRVQFAPGHELEVALEGERLFVKNVSCAACRRVMGRAMVADLARLDDAGLRIVENVTGLPSDAPLLRDAEAWRKFYRDRPLPAPRDGGTP